MFLWLWNLMAPFNLTNAQTQYALSSFCKNVFHHNFLARPHE